MSKPLNERSETVNDQAAQTVLQSIEMLIGAHYIISPGGRSAPLVFAVGQRDAAQSTVILDERQAAFFALGYGRASPNELATLICTSGSAGAHYLPAIIEADYNGTPLLVITADRPDRLRGTGAAQTIEQRAFFGHHVVQSAHVNVDMESLPTVSKTVETLVNRALSTRGPVHLNLGFDEPLHVPSQIEPPPRSQAMAERSMALRSLEVTEITDSLTPSRAGLLILGPNAVQGDSEKKAMHALIDRLGWICFAHAASGMPRQASSGILAASIDHFLAPDPPVLGSPSTILYVGQAPTSRRLLNYLTQHPNVISLSRGRHAVHPWLHGHAYSGLSTALIEGIINQLGQSEGNSAATLTVANALVEDAMAANRSSTLWSGPVLEQLLEDGDCKRNILVGNSLPIRDMDLFTGRIPRHIHIYGNRGVNGIDGHFATASGIASAQPEAQTILMCGDLTALHDIGALCLASTIQLKIIVIDNGGGGVFNQLEFAEESEVFRRFFTTQQTTPLADICAAYGIHVHHVDTLSALDLRSVLGESGSSLCIVKVNALDARQARVNIQTSIQMTLEQDV